MGTLFMVGAAMAALWMAYTAIMIVLYPEILGIILGKDETPAQVSNTLRWLIVAQILTGAMIILNYVQMMWT